MKISSKILVLLLFAACLISGGYGCSSYNYREGGPIITTGMFGNPNDGCTGKGICKSGLFVSADTLTINSDTAKHTFTMIFNLTADTSNPAEQGQNFIWRSYNPNNAANIFNYAFDVPFDISIDNPDTNIQKLGLPSGSLIPANTPFTFSYANPMVTMTTPIATVGQAPFPAFVIFGGTDSSGVFNNSIPGIFACNIVPPPPVNGIKPIPCFFALRKGDASTLLLYFNASSLDSLQPSQAPNFQKPSYNFNSSFCLNVGNAANNLISHFFLTQNSFIGQNQVVKLKNSPTFDTIILKYNCSLAPYGINNSAITPNGFTINWVNNYPFTTYSIASITTLDGQQVPISQPKILPDAISIFGLHPATTYLVTIGYTMPCGSNGSSAVDTVTTTGNSGTKKK